MIKRFFDLSISILSIIILFPISLIISLLIICLMPGPILFVQERISRFGKPFRLYKFRTMQISTGSKAGSFEAGDKSRITKLGAILRKSKIDELPQLINVFKGDMSIVGPRPEVESWTKVYPEKWAIVLKVRPGISDYASILYRNEEDILASSTNPTEVYRNEILPKKLDLNIDYINNQSFIGDIKIILKTIKAVIKK